MAQNSSYTPISLYHSTTASAVPLNTNLVDGELALNITDGKLYYKDNLGVVQLLATKGGAAVASNLSGGIASQIPYQSAPDTTSFIPNGTAGTPLLSNGTSAPGFGVLGISGGGTGQTTATAAFNALAPSQSSNANKVLVTDGTNASWSTVGIVSGGTNATSFTAKSGNVAGLVFYDGTKLANDATVTNVGYDTSTNTLKSLNAAIAGIATINCERENQFAISASNIDLSMANYFTKTISATTTFTVSNVAPSGTTSAFILSLTNGGSQTINWWSGVKWAGGTAPSLTSSGRDVLGFFTYDGGTIWTGLLLGKDIK